MRPSSFSLSVRKMLQFSCFSLPCRHWSQPSHLRLHLSPKALNLFRRFVSCTHLTTTSPLSSPLQTSLPPSYVLIPLFPLLWSLRHATFPHYYPPSTLARAVVLPMAIITPDVPREVRAFTAKQGVVLQFSCFSLPCRHIFFLVCLHMLFFHVDAYF